MNRHGREWKRQAKNKLCCLYLVWRKTLSSISISPEYLEWTLPVAILLCSIKYQIPSRVRDLKILMELAPEKNNGICTHVPKGILWRNSAGRLSYSSQMKCRARSPFGICRSVWLYSTKAHPQGLSSQHFGFLSLFRNTQQ